MMNLENNITLKIKYHSQNKNRIVEYIQNYNSVVKYTYNRLLENNNFKIMNKNIINKKKDWIFIIYNYIILFFWK